MSATIRTRSTSSFATDLERPLRFQAWKLTKHVTTMARIPRLIEKGVARKVRCCKPVKPHLPSAHRLLWPLSWNQQNLAREKRTSMNLQGHSHFPNLRQYAWECTASLRQSVPVARISKQSPHFLDQTGFCQRFDQPVKIEICK